MSPRVFFQMTGREVLVGSYTFTAFGVRAFLDEYLQQSDRGAAVQNPFTPID